MDLCAERNSCTWLNYRLAQNYNRKTQLAPGSRRLHRDKEPLCVGSELRDGCGLIGKNVFGLPRFQTIAGLLHAHELIQSTGGPP